jgi:caffeoyl-CoA O-methyltransferase
MPDKSYLTPTAIYEYMQSISLREPALLARLREETASHPRAIMQIPPEQGQFMALLVHLLGVRKALEIGVFKGYSSLSVAMALPEDGRLIALDVSEEYTAIARRYWRDAGVDNKVDLRIGPAIDSLQAILAAGEAGTFDLAFIDADKPSYDSYYEAVLQLLRPKGLLAIDNVFLGGRCADPSNSEPEVLAMRALNQKIQRDDRVWVSTLTIADGVTLVVKR